MSTIESPRPAVILREAAKPRPRWQVILVRPETVTFLLLIIATIVATRLSPFFADLGFILESSTYYVEFAIVALVLTIVIISGEIDLSPAAQMALSACLFGTAYRAGAPIPVAILVSLVSGLAMGAFNAFFITVLRLPSIIVTIGTLILYRGLAQVLAGDKSIGSFPGWFVGIDYRMIGIVPVPVMIFIIASVLLGLFLGITILGRQIYQIGTSEVAAIHAGIRVRRIKFGLFLASGLTSSIAGLLTASRLGSVRYDLASGGELTMVLIVMLGGTYIFGGRGSILGTFLAAWLLVIIATGMTVANIAINAQLTVMGLLLIVSIIATNAIYARSQR
ncbi:ABC transporter permease [Kaistia dalseonensis]|uniref:Autoinducer 2 import system permease protein LsrD n=1 Tax=Kaistia dalseonensis TaxID=410840 RepID=A0ABU0HCH2_9HYPH|nr:ABC transporter permease [Kaistia dalseonensis]MCX5496603.1 ABC transporter permease [Kaistia dalseonensis]MDQ0439226.1 rhamnose transport system permease protein [Kaistia dalseonensis]